MVHIPQLITDLGLIMGAAAVVTLLFKKLKQPIVLGYIIAGLLVGPHFSFFPSVTDSDNIVVWAEIGVIFLLFSLGLEFSFKKLMKVGGAASITATVEVAVMLFLGYITGVALGWSTMDCIFLGGVLSISSTTIIIRAFDELGLKGKKFAGLVFGILVVEDLVAIVLLVLLSTLAVSQQFNGTDMFYSVVKLVFFLILWFVSGIFFLPSLLRKVRHYMNDEMLLITSIALCIMMVVLATQVGFSPALGAFIMGSILAETTLGGKIEHLMKSVKEVFGAVFFVSVGMLIDPAMLVEYIGPILLIVLITVLGKLTSSTLGAIIAGQPLKTSLQAGMSLAQIGEFSFIIATLGLTLNVTSAFLYPIAVAVSAITTFTTPYLIKASEPLYHWLNGKLPQKWTWAMDKYSAGAQTARVASDWNLVLRTYLTQIGIYAVIISGLLFVSIEYLIPFAAEKKSPGLAIAIIVVILLIVSPFLWALAIRKIQPDATFRLWGNYRYRGPILLLKMLRLVLTIGFIALLVGQMPATFQTIIALAFVILMITVLYKKLQDVYENLEGRFMVNFNDKEAEERKEHGTYLVPWDAHITHFAIPANYAGIGQTLLELQMRESFGINIAMIKRGNITIPAPSRYEKVFPGDIVYIIGTDEQIESFARHVEQHIYAPASLEAVDHEISLLNVEVSADSEFIGLSIKESEIREKTKGLIVGVERDGKRLLNPESDLVLAAHDLLWIVGNKKKIIPMFQKGENTTAGSEKNAAITSAN